MTANDKTFPEGRVGFGSFDNFGRLRDLSVTAAATDTTAPVATVKSGAEFTSVATASTAGCRSSSRTRGRSIG